MLLMVIKYGRTKHHIRIDLYFSEELFAYAVFTFFIIVLCKLRKNIVNTYLTSSEYNL